MPLLLLIAFIVVPIAELWVVVEVGSRIGVPLTLVILLAVSVAGAWLVKREGRSAWARFREALGTRIPAVEVVDGALVLIGGTLLLTPGFLTDAVGLLLVLPPTRSLVNRGVRARVRASFGLAARPGPKTRSTAPGEVDVEVVDVRRNGVDGP